MSNNSNSASPSRPPHRRLRRVFLTLYAHVVLISVTKNAEKGTPVLTRVSSRSSRSYSVVDIDINHDATTGDVAGDIAPVVRSSRVVTQQNLARIVNEKNLVLLSEFGGVEGIAEALGTDVENGIRGEAEYLYWKTPPAPSKGFFRFTFEALKDHIILLLLLCAVLSVVFGIMEEGSKEGWYDGVTIFLAILVVVIATAISNFYRARKLQKRSDEANNMDVDVIRGGHAVKIPLFRVVVGDIVCLKIGDRVPADGLFLDVRPLQVDEALDWRIDREHNPFLFSGAKVIDGSGHMLVTSVGMMTECGEMMSSVTRERNEKTPLSVRLDKLHSNVQKIGLVLTLLIIVGLFLRFYFLHKKDDENGLPELRGKRTAIVELMEAIERIITRQNGVISISVATLSVVLIGIQEGLPFSVTLSLCYWKRMMSHEAIVQKLSSFETLGSTTIICTDKTEWLMLEVDKLWVGEEAIDEDQVLVRAPIVHEALCEGVGLNMTHSSILVPGFYSSLIEDPILSWAQSKLGLDMEKLKRSRTILKNEAFDSERKRCGVLVRKNEDNEKSFCSHWKGAPGTILPMCSAYYDSGGNKRTMSEDMRMVFRQVIAGMEAKRIQSIAFAYDEEEENDNKEEEEEDDDDCNDDDDEDDDAASAGNNIDKVFEHHNHHHIDDHGDDDGGGSGGGDDDDDDHDHDDYKISSLHHCHDHHSHDHYNASEDDDDYKISDNLCHHNHDNDDGGGGCMDGNQDGDEVEIFDDDHDHRGDDDHDHNRDCDGDEDNNDKCDNDDAPNLKEYGLTWLAMVGLKNQFQLAVEACRDAEVKIILVSGDNISAATTMAIESGIIRPGEDLNRVVLDGKDFRSEEEMLEMVDRIRVMATSLPSNKLLLVKCLKKRGQVVALTGVNTTDSPALKEADIGLSVWTRSNEMVKENSDIVILNNNFSSIPVLIKAGRCAYNNIQKFVQVYLTMNIVAAAINLVAAVASGQSALTAFQFLWANFIMDTLGALALAAQSPNQKLMENQPIPRTAPLITKLMWRNIISQALYQIPILLILQFKEEIFSGEKPKVKTALIFNTFILCQVCNEFNTIKLEKNMFQVIYQNRLFLLIVGIIICLQVVVVEFLKSFSGAERLNWEQWGVCIGIATFGWLIGSVAKWVPVSR